MLILFISESICSDILLKLGFIALVIFPPIVNSVFILDGELYVYIISFFIIFFGLLTIFFGFPFNINRDILDIELSFIVGFMA